MDRLKKLLSRCKDLILRGYAMFQENRVSVYSGYATLFIVTAVAPFVALIIAVVNLLPGYSAKDVADILFQILPDLGPIRDMVESMMINLKGQSGGPLASAAGVTTLWSASKGVSAIQKGLDEMDRDDDDEPEEGEAPGIKEKALALLKGILRRLLYTLTLIILIPALLVFEMLGDNIANIIRGAMEKIDPDVMSSTLSGVDSFFHISSLVVILFALLAILQIYAALPAKRRKMKSQLPGAVMTGISWLLFTKLFSFFIPRFYHASALYGSLAALFLLLLWLRFMVMILFAGGILNHVLEEEKPISCAA